MRSERNQKFVDINNLYVGLIVDSNRGKATITKIRNDLLRIDYETGGFDGVYFDEFDKYGITLEKPLVPRD